MLLDYIFFFKKKFMVYKMCLTGNFLFVTGKMQRFKKGRNHDIVSKNFVIL